MLALYLVNDAFSSLELPFSVLHKFENKTSLKILKYVLRYVNDVFSSLVLAFSRENIYLFNSELEFVRMLGFFFAILWKDFKKLKLIHII